MNILITYLSFYGKKAERSYHTNGLCAEERVIASQTNEPVLRMLEKRLEEKGEKIDRVIPILSRLKTRKVEQFPIRPHTNSFKGLQRRSSERLMFYSP